MDHEHFGVDPFSDTFKVFGGTSLGSWLSEWHEISTLDLDGLDVPSCFSSPSGLILLVSWTESLELALVVGEIFDAITLTVPQGKGGKFAIIAPRLCLYLLVWISCHGVLLGL